MPAHAEMALPWLPVTGWDVQPAGKWWDAVRVEEELAERTLESLRLDTGAVLQDRGTGGRLYWLIKPGAAESWPPMPRVWVLGAGSHIMVPATSWDGMRTFWRVPPRSGRCLTDAKILRAALLGAA